MSDSTTHESSKAKTCSTCGEARLITDFSPDKRSRDGLQSRCKICYRKYDRIRYAARREKVREYGQAYRLANAEKIRERNRAYYVANIEKIQERSRAWAVENREKRRKIARAWDARNPEKRRELNRAWSAKNPEKVRACRRRYLARKVDAEGTHTIDDVQQQYENQKGRCYYCQEKVGGTYHVDHVIPLARGGSDGPENLVIACPACNTSKQDKLPHEWPEGGRLL